MHKLPFEDKGVFEDPQTPPLNSTPKKGKFKAKLNYYYPLFYYFNIS